MYRLWFALLSIGSALWALRAIRSVEMPYRMPLVAYFVFQVLFTVMAEIAHGVYGNPSNEYRDSYTIGVFGVLCASLIAGIVCNLLNPVALSIGLSIPALLGYLLYLKVEAVWWKGVPYEMELLVAQVVILLASGLLAALAWKRVDEPSVHALAVFWLLFAAWKAGVCFGNLRGPDIFLRNNTWVPVTMTVATFSWIGFWRKNSMSSRRRDNGAI